MNKEHKLIEGLIYYGVEIKRQLLIEVLGKSVSSVSRLLTEYRDLYPNQIELDPSKKCYIKAQGFKPIAENDCYALLSLIYEGKQVYIYEPIYSQASPSLTVSPLGHATLKQDCIAHLSYAVLQGFKVEVEYNSGSSGNSKRVMQPTNIIKVQSEWYVRAYCHKNQQFRIFSLSRFESCDLLNKERVTSMDHDWHEKVILTLGPHSKHKHPESVRFDLGLENKPVVNFETNKALAGLLMLKMHVDCSSDASLCPKSYKIQLMNRHELLNVQSLIDLAPGWKES